MHEPSSTVATGLKLEASAYMQPGISFRQDTSKVAVDVSGPRAFVSSVVSCRRSSCARPAAAHAASAISATRILVSTCCEAYSLSCARLALVLRARRFNCVYASATKTPRETPPAVVDAAVPIGDVICLLAPNYDPKHDSSALYSQELAAPE